MCVLRGDLKEEVWKAHNDSKVQLGYVFHYYLRFIVITRRINQALFYLHDLKIKRKDFYLRNFIKVRI